MLDIFLSLNRSRRIVVSLEVYELLQAVSFGEAWHGAFTMLVNAPN